MSEKAVIDRFEEEWAVLLVGEDETQLDVKRSELPEDASEGDWLQVEIESDCLISAVVDEEETEKVRSRIMRKLERLRRGEQLKEAD